jgi:nucleoside phosphorylase
LLEGECAISRTDIETACSASDAREKLRNTVFDLLILDVALPLRFEDEPEWRVSIELLNDITETGRLKKPSYIIGCTAYDDLLEKLAESFQNHTWTIVHYDVSTDAWKGPLKECIKYIEGKAIEHSVISYSIDVCIICALQSEMDQIHRLDWSWEDPIPLDDNTFVRYGKIPSGANMYRVATAIPSRMGMMSTALLAAKLISRLRPRFLVMAGICAGVEGKANIGDMILADPSWDWQSGKHVVEDTGPQFAIAPHQLPIPDFIRARGLLLKTEAGLWSSIRHAYGGQAPATELKFQVSPMASGSAVLADSAVVQEIKRQERNLTGVEMEVYGLYAAAACAAFPRPTAFAIKSVCDFGDKSKNNEHQRYAAYTSAKAVELFLTRYLNEIVPFAGS